MPRVAETCPKCGAVEVVPPDSTVFILDKSYRRFKCGTEASNDGIKQSFPCAMRELAQRDARILELEGQREGLRGQVTRLMGALKPFAQADMFGSFGPSLKRYFIGWGDGDIGRKAMDDARQALSSTPAVKPDGVWLSREDAGLLIEILECLSRHGSSYPGSLATLERVQSLKAVLEGKEATNHE